MIRGTKAVLKSRPDLIRIDRNISRSVLTSRKSTWRYDLNLAHEVRARYGMPLPEFCFWRVTEFPILHESVFVTEKYL